MARIRQPAVAGMFYDGDPAALRDHVDLLLRQAHGVEHQGTIVGLVSPHAGYMYSGLAAAAGYRALKGVSFDVVFLVGPSHREFFTGASMYPGDAYRTPLGDVLLNVEARASLAAESGCLKLSEAGHRSEHSLEVQLPFLQRVLGSFTIVPIVIGDQTPEACFEVGRALAKVARDYRALLVASSDLSHFHPYDDAVLLDRRVIDSVESFDEKEMMNLLADEQLEACGGGPVVSVMLASKLLGANRSQALYYCNSGD
ncbi:MAG: AmmeMemoRadiSam system protein B, partial [Ignavibacteria bacterium GWA2_54_16]